MANFIFFGTPEFSAIILEKLIKADFIPAAVVCNPDRPVGRKQVTTPPPIKQRIMNYESGIKNKIKILQPEKLDPSLFIIPNSSFDFFIVAAYARIIPKEILDVPRLGSIGVHPSLLPKYRGATPIQSAILAGEKKTGVTLFLMDEKVDHGAILSNEKLVMRNEETTEALTKKLADLGADLLIETLPKFIKGEITPLPQDESQTTYTKKFKTEDAYIEPQDLDKAESENGQTAIEIERKIRALNPEPGTWTILNNKRTKLLEAEIIDGSTSLTINPEQHRRIDGKLKLKKIQKEGGKPITL